MSEKPKFEVCEPKWVRQQTIFLYSLFFGRGGGGGGGRLNTKMKAVCDVVYLQS